jgi:uncharacterized membrane protein YeaQ/YmgE (transglycosylase-associated protein family)
MVGALLLGFVCGVIARVLMPGDVFRNLSGPASWGLSLVLGLVGALVGYVIFTLGLGIGDTDIFERGRPARGRRRHPHRARARGLLPAPPPARPAAFRRTAAGPEAAARRMSPLPGARGRGYGMATRGR